MIIPALRLLPACLLLSLAGALAADKETSPADRRFDAANSLQSRQRFEQAANEWEAFLEQQPEDRRAGFALYWLGICRFNLEQYEPAAKTFQRLLKEHPGTRYRNRALIYLETAYRALGQKKKAQRVEAQIPEGDVASLLRLRAPGSVSVARVLTAEEMMVRAHEARMTWGEGFPGFEAEMVVRADGEVHRCSVKVTAGGAVLLNMPKPRPKSVEWAQDRLQSVVDHRQAGSRKYDVSFADDDTDHPFGRLIKFNQDRLHSVYRIQGDLIREVHRTVGQTRFIISVIEVTQTAEKKYLPRTYTVSYWDADSGGLKRSDTFYSGWTRVGAFDLPARLLVVTTAGDRRRDVRELRLSDHRLLKAETPK